MAKKTTTKKGSKKKTKKRATGISKKGGTISQKKTKKRATVNSKKGSTVPQKKTKKRKGYGKKDLEHFKNIILTQRQEILEEITTLRESIMDSSTGEYTGENSSYSIHMADQGGEQMDREITFLFASREGKYLRYLGEALQRIENGNYGFCRDCGDLIDKERLEAVPVAQQCVSCKTKSSQTK